MTESEGGRGGGPRLARRTVLRAGAGTAAGLLLGRSDPVSAAPARQDGPSIRGGRWSEIDQIGLAQRVDPAEFTSFATEFPFNAVAPSWSGEGDPGAMVELLWSADGVTWSDPVWIGLAGHRGPDRDGRNIGSLVATPGASFLQYRTYDSAGNLTTLPGFELDYIDASAGSSLAQVAAPATTPLFGQPPVISRPGWGADESLRYDDKGKEIFPVEYQQVEHVIIHHADTANFNDPVLEMRSIFYFHAITRGWGDIAYNYLVDFMGNVYEGRVGGENAVGSHAEGYNYGSCGICLMGRFFEDDITPEMHNGIVWATSWAARDLDPDASSAFHDIPELPTICGHRDVNNTTCPGDDFYRTLGTIRGEVRRVVKGRDDPEPPPPEWLPGMHVITNEEDANLRSGPGLDFDIVTDVASGEPLTVLEGPTTNNRIIWYKVQGSSLDGWIAGRLLRRDPNAPAATPPEATAEPPAESPPPAETATPVEDPPVAETPADDGAVGGGEEPADDSGKGKDGNRDRDGGRDRGKDERQEAWPVFSPGTTAIVIDGPLNLRGAPALWAEIVTEMPDGYPVTITDGPAPADGIAWYQIVTPDGGIGWCDGTYLQPY
ncbi:MAG: SH3 domain-containing protein [Thermomicrobiales bacterium]